MSQVKATIFSEFANFNEEMDKNLHKLIEKFKKDKLFKNIFEEEKKMTIEKFKEKFKMKHDKFKKLPYLDVKVVKVEKKKTICPKCGQEIKIKDENMPGNWVNGENIDKIKFPCFCSYLDYGDRRHSGQLNMGYSDINSKALYQLHNIDIQSDNNRIGTYYSLKGLINKYDIHILKGKIIIFWEEE